MRRTLLSVLIACIPVSAFSQDLSAKFLSFLKNSITVKDVCFSPAGHCDDKLVRLIDKARGSVDIAIFSFTNRKIADALIRAKRRGVRVRVVMDKSNISNRFSVLPLLERAGIPVRIWLGQGLMHNKYAIIDDEVVETGSFNYTNSAVHRNRENFVVIKGKSLALKYAEDFNNLWTESVPVQKIFSLP